MKHKIYVVAEGEAPCIHSIALAEDGTLLVEHMSSILVWAYLDMGVHPESKCKHDQYDAHYGAGNWELEWVEDPKNHAGFQSAYELNQKLKREPMKTPDLIAWLKQHIAYTDEEGDRGYKLNVSLAAARLQALDARVAELTQALEFVARHCTIRETKISGVCDVSVASMSLAISMENEFRHAPSDSTPFDLILRAAKADACKEPTK